MQYVLVGLAVLAILSALASSSPQWPWAGTAAIVFLGIGLLLIGLGVKVP